MSAEPAAHGPGSRDAIGAPVGGDDVTGVTSAAPDAGPVDPHTSVAARPLVAIVRVYQHAAAGRPSPCRHVPSCSTYAVEALQVHGAVKGSWLAAKRLGRCHPWGTQGYDPVPDRKAS